MASKHSTPDTAAAHNGHSTLQLSQHTMMSLTGQTWLGETPITATAQMQEELLMSQHCQTSLQPLTEWMPETCVHGDGRLITFAIATLAV